MLARELDDIFVNGTERECHSSVWQIMDAIIIQPLLRAYLLPPTGMCDSPVTQHIIISSVSKSGASFLTQHLQGNGPIRHVETCPDFFSLQEYTQQNTLSKF
jgi:hypothetical protein